MVSLEGTFIGQERQFVVLGKSGKYEKDMLETGMGSLVIVWN